MSQRTVQLIIGRILTDEELRQKFLVSPCQTLTWLRDMGFELTDTEIEALSHSDERLWTSGADALDSRLQQCCLKRQRGVT
jgi:hypothetical protein